MPQNRNGKKTLGAKTRPRGSSGPNDRAGTGRPGFARAKSSDFSKATPKAKQDLGSPAPAKGERVAKIIARAGLCSRRDAEAWIAEGRVSVNGQLLTSPAVALGPSDQISIDGKPLAPRQRTRLFLFHKPRGLVTTTKDPQGRPTIFDHLHQHAPDAPRLMSIGRLDINTEGLLLLTNDGGLARLLELPSTGWLRRYRVRANGMTDQAKLDALAKGVTIEGVRYAGIEATLDRQQGANCWLTMGLREGKNREIKRVLEHLGLTVNRLIRLSFGPFQLGDLPQGKIEEVRTRVLRDQLGPALTQAAGLDFDAPIESIAEKKEPAAYGKQRARRAQPEPETPTVRSRPKPGPRKHISVLRSEEKAKPSQNQRQRSEHGEVADRKGRKVAIERRVSEPAGKASRPDRKPPRKGGPLAGKKTMVRPERRQQPPDGRPSPSGKRPPRRP